MDTVNDRPTDENGQPVDRRQGWWSKAFEDPVGIPDDARIAAAGIFLAYVVFTAVWLWLTRASVFDPLKWASGAAALAGGFGVWFFGRGKE